MIEVLDLFAGAGGFSLGAHNVSGDVMGIELDADAVATQSAADMWCVKRDITEIDPNNIGRTNEGAHLHIHASPPCQTFSAAGKGEGRKHLELLCDAVRQILDPDCDVLVDLSDVPAGSLLTLQPAYWIRTIMPDTVSLEQVRSVLPLWEAYAEGLQGIGYQTWTALLSAEQYGVPQTRQRAWLGASLHRQVQPPTPTHSRYHVRKPDRLDAGVLPWVSMADALGWGMTARSAHTVTGGGTGSGGGAEPFGNGSRKVMEREEDEGRWLTGFPRKADNGDNITLDGVDYRARDLRADDQPSFVVTEKARSWSHWRQTDQSRATTRPISSPAGTIAFGKDAAAMRFTDDVDDVGYRTQHLALEDTPATTIQGDERVWPRGHKVNQADINRLGEDGARERYGDRGGKNSRKITIAEAGVLQGFPAEYPWQGVKTSQFRQCGNAVPPAVAEAVLRSLI